MTVFEYYDGPSYGSVTIFVIAAIILALYGGEKSIENTTTAARS